MTNEQVRRLTILKKDIERLCENPPKNIALIVIDGIIDVFNGLVRRYDYHHCAAPITTIQQEVKDFYAKYDFLRIKEIQHIFWEIIG